MKNTKTTLRCLLFSVFLLSSGILVIGQSKKGSMERFKEEKIAYFNQKLNLSEKESDKFWAVYEDLHNRNMKINEDEKNLLNYYSCNYDAMSEQEVDETISKFMDLQKERSNLTYEYHEKFVKIIGKRKTMKMYAIEREFRIYLLEKFRSQRDHDGGNRDHQRE